MKTCRISKQTLDQLYKCWIDFYNKRVDAINYLRKQKLDAINAEAQAEMKKDSMSKNDIVDWYEIQLAKMREWMDDAKRGLDKAESNFESFYQQIKDTVYTEDDLGYTYIYDFYKVEIRKNKNEKDNIVSVKFMMYHWDYTFYPFKVEKIQFKPPKVKLTPWEEFQ